MKGAAQSTEISNNRKARRDFHIEETYECGIALRGTEVKSIRAGKINLGDAFARVDPKTGEIFLHGCDIQPYEQASFEQHEAKRARKLLLHKREIEKLRAETAERGKAIVALRAYWKNRKVKIEIGVGKGKKAHDKREDVKKREANREAERAMRSFNKR
ncbi:MAG: SsrA-binding protein SmpB [Verrucomicrobiales bacterium]